MLPNSGPTTGAADAGATPDAATGRAPDAAAGRAPDASPSPDPREPDPGPSLPDAAFRQMADSAPVMIWRSDTTGACDFFNRPWLEFAGRPMEQEIGQGWAERVHPEDLAGCLARFQRAIADRAAFAMDYRLRRHDGAWRWIRDTGTPLMAGGRFAGFVGSCTDITDMRDALDGLRRADAEREALLAELRHRVKNNAQATISFLALQARRAPDAGIAEALRSAATRVLLASKVQDRKFHGATLHAVELGEELGIAARAAVEAVGRRGIALELAPLADGLLLAHGQAIPLALLASEILVNALRHAFPPGQAGRVQVALARLPDGQVELRIADDGIGLPEPFRQQPPRDCLGLHLAARLARQAQGTLRFEGPPGTVAVVTFRPG